MNRRLIGGIAILLVTVIALVPAQQAPAPPVDDKALASAESRPGDWLSYGRDYYEQRFSPLDQINDTNAAQLGLAWSFETATDRGLEATPLVIDGVMYTTGSWSVVYAVDARTGKQLWKFDPEVHRKYDQLACCDVVNRGAAFYKGRVYLGALDGRLIAIDAKSGKPSWSVTTVDQKQAYTSTGSTSAPATAPRGIARFAVPVAATTSTSRRSWPSIPTTASWSGTTRPSPATRGTTPRCSR
jgi:quinohemoprotein ethanol dehydrogenase